MISENVVSLAPAQALLTEEIAAVEQLLEDAIATLYAPLRELARSQLRKVQPLRRAMVVLAAAIGTNDSATYRQQRLYLAAALEMLNVALAVHQLLLAESNQGENPNQRSITGSVILTGDYCFTQAAILAAKTNHVRVVEIFSETLKSVSEGILRKVFAAREHQNSERIPMMEPSDTPINTERALCEAGVEGAAVLTQADSTANAESLAILNALFPQWQNRPDSVSIETLSMDHLPPVQRQRWLTIALNG